MKKLDKSVLTKKILCSILAAGAIGFAYSGAAYAAEGDSAASQSTDNRTTITNDNILTENDGSTKLITGGDNGGIIIKTDGSVGALLQEAIKNQDKLNPNNPTQMLSTIKHLLAQESYTDGKKFIVTGAVGGHAQIDSNTNSLLTSSLGETIDGKIGGVLGKLASKNTAGTDNLEISSDLNNQVGGLKTGDTKSQPVIIGFSGGDLSINTGVSGTLVVDALPEKVTTTINRTGNIYNNIDSGNILGGFGGSTAIALGNITASVTDKTSTLAKLVLQNTNLSFDGNTSVTLDGSISTAINDSANAAAFANGGGAIAVGGSSTSTVTGNSSLTVDSEVSGDGLEGISTGITGGGAAVSTLGGNAESTVKGSTTVTINDGLTALAAGGGVAASIDAAGLSGKGNDNGISDFGIDIQNKGFLDFGIALTTDPNKFDLGVYIGQDEDGKRVSDGGTATAVTGDTTVNLLGTTTAAGVVGGGIAEAYHSYTQRWNTSSGADIIGKSTAKSTTGKTNVNIELDSSNLTQDNKNKLISGLKDAIGSLNKTDANSIITALKDSVSKLSGNGAAAAIIGGGIASALDDSTATTAPSDDNRTTASVSNEGANVNLISGYDVGVFGGGVAQATNYAQASSTTTEDINVNVYDGTEAIGVFGNGGAYFTGTSNGGTRNLDGSATVTAEKNTNINVFGGKVDGLFGGGLAVDDSQSNVNNATVDTKGTSTINVAGGEVNKLNYGALNGFFGTGAADEAADNANYLAAVSKAAADTAIAAGGVAVGGGANANVNKSVVNIADGTVNGDIIGGGIAVYGYESNANKGATVGESTINLAGGKVDGSIYAGGLTSTRGEAKNYGAAKSTVDKAVVNLAGAEVTGEISGRGLANNGTTFSINEDSIGKDGSTLNITGYNTLSPLTGEYANTKSGNKSKINNFDAINVDANSVTVLKDLTAGSNTALIDANGKTINVAPGASLDISEFESGTDAANPNKYFIVNNYDKDKSTLWNKDKFVYDRTQYFADTETVKDTENEEGEDYSITYKTIDQLTDDEKDEAAESFMSRLGNDRLRNAFYQYYSNQAGVKGANPGFDELLSDLSQVGNQAAAGAALGSSAMVGESSGATNTSTTFAGDMADTAALRLSFTQDRVTGDNKIDEDGNIWAKYLHNKYKGEGLAGSFGDMHFDASYDGIMVGSDFAKKGKVQSGIAFAYADGDSSGIGSEDDFDLWGLTFYGNVKNDDTNIIADIGYSRGDHETSAYVLDKKMTADRDISVFSLGVRAEKLITKGSLQIVPYTGLRYLNVDPSSYTAYYNGKKAFDIDPDRQNIFTLPVGVSLRNEHVTKNGWTITPQFDLSYVWAFGDTDNDMTVNMAGAADKLSYTVMDSGSWLTSLALEAGKGDWTYGLGYSWQKGNDARSDKWFVNAEYKF